MMSLNKTITKLNIIRLQIAIVFINLAINLLELQKSDRRQVDHMKDIMFGYKEVKNNGRQSRTN